MSGQANDENVTYGCEDLWLSTEKLYIILGCIYTAHVSVSSSNGHSKFRTLPMLIILFSNTANDYYYVYGELKIMVN